MRLRDDPDAVLSPHLRNVPILLSVGCAAYNWCHVEGCPAWACLFPPRPVRTGRRYPVPCGAFRRRPLEHLSQVQVCCTPSGPPARA